MPSSCRSLLKAKGFLFRTYCCSLLVFVDCVFWTHRKRTAWVCCRLFLTFLTWRSVSVACATLITKHLTGCLYLWPSFLQFQHIKDMASIAPSSSSKNCDSLSLFWISNNSDTWLLKKKPFLYIWSRFTSSRKHFRLLQISRSLEIGSVAIFKISCLISERKFRRKISIKAFSFIGWSKLSVYWTSAS